MYHNSLFVFKRMNFSMQLKNPAAKLISLNVIQDIIIFLHSSLRTKMTNYKQESSSDKIVGSENKGLYILIF